MATKLPTIKETVALPGGNRFDIEHATTKQKKFQIAVSKRKNRMLNIKKEQSAVREDPIFNDLNSAAVNKAMTLIFGDES